MSLSYSIRTWFCVYVVPPYFTAHSHMQPQQVLGSSHSSYCGMDNEYQISAIPTNELIRSASQLRGQCSYSSFCFFSAPDALCEKITKPSFSQSILFCQ